MTIIPSIIGAILMSIASVMYLLIAVGVPIGDFAFGGQYKVPPIRLRIACGFSILAQLFAVVILLQVSGLFPLWFSFSITRIVCFVFAGYLTINTGLNFFSKSKKEKWTATPLSLVTAICFWIVAISA